MTDIYNGFDTLGGHAAIAALGANDDFVQIRDDFAALANNKD